jgi:abhydrolase domain-containing protein 12
VYKSFSSLSANTHLLAFDYRGFGRSTGSPSEPGLITDGITVVNYALESLGLPRNRIALVGQSLGTAVLSGTLEHFVVREEKKADDGVEDFAAVLLVSGFRSMRILLPRYCIAGLVPILAPLAKVPGLMDAMVGHLAEAWDSEARLKAVVERAAEDVKAGKKRALNLQLMHSIDDSDIPFDNTELMYAEVLGVARSTLGKEAEGVDVGSVKEGAVRRDASWPGLDLGLRLVKKGGHNDIPTNTAVAVALMKALGLIDGS